MKRAAVLVFALLAGCNLYSHNSGDDVCNGGTAAGVAEQTLRDPSTGVCNTTSYGGGGDCDGACCAEPASGIDVPVQIGSTCDGACEGLDETACVQASGCHALYVEPGIAYPDVVDSNGNQAVFAQCWDIQPMPVSEGGDCTTYDAYTCAMHDDCVSIFNGISDALVGDAYGSFSQCAAETTTPPNDCSTLSCGSGSTCEEQCYPCDPTDGSDGCMSACGPICVPDTACNGVDCGPGSTCGVSCDPTGNCASACFPTGPSDPGECTGTVTCNLAPPTCPAGTDAGIENGCWTGFCIPESDCGPKNPGACGPDGVTCNITGPACPAGTVPGVLNGCWSGYCIPDSQCPAPACETLTAEDACVARPDCEPVYNGMGCTCTPDGACTCSSETFARCVTLDDTGGGSGGGSGTGSGGGGGGSGFNPGGPIIPAFAAR